MALLLGAGGMYLAQKRREVIQVTEFVKVGQAGERAHAAYRHDPAAVAIPALSQYLLILEEAESIPEFCSYMPTNLQRFDMALVHARLAKLYARVDQPDLSAQHVAEALACVRAAGRGSVITNWAALEEIVARFDHNAKD